MWNVSTLRDSQVCKVLRGHHRAPLTPNCQSVSSRNVAVCSVKCAKRALLCSILVLSVRKSEGLFAHSSISFLFLSTVAICCRAFDTKWWLTTGTFFPAHFSEGYGTCFKMFSPRLQHCWAAIPQFVNIILLVSTFFFEGQHGEHISSPTASLKRIELPTFDASNGHLFVAKRLESCEESSNRKHAGPSSITTLTFVGHGSLKILKATFSLEPLAFEEFYPNHFFASLSHEPAA